MRTIGHFLALIAALLFFSPTASNARDLNSLLAKAKAGNLKAELDLSGYYFNQAGIDAFDGNPWQQRLDNNSNFYWLMKSAFGGYPPAEDTLGADYLEGMGIQKNCSRALYWLHKSATQGYVRAQKLLDTPSIMGACGYNKSANDLATHLPTLIPQ
jgi:TPR repeat protein